MTHLGELLSNEPCLLAHVAITPGRPLHLHPSLVCLLSNVAVEHIPDILEEKGEPKEQGGGHLLAGELLPPLLQQLGLGALAGKVEEVVVLELSEGRGV